ncbi:MAG: TIGR02449 family protein [Xanthomonadaceae bacterium]|nr:TIGR02449 family protein [Xanthomonadaceae bacterium]
MSSEAVNHALDQIEQQLAALFARVDELEHENRSLLARQQTLVAERANLVKRNEEARTRVEGMIERLKSLESAGR